MPTTKSKRKSTKTSSDPTEFSMPVEVKNWIESANSRLSYLTSEVQRLKEENAKLKAGIRFAEHRILRTDKE